MRKIILRYSHFRVDNNGRWVFVVSNLNTANDKYLALHERVLLSVFRPPANVLTVAVLLNNGMSFGLDFKRKKTADDVYVALLSMLGSNGSQPTMESQNGTEIFTNVVADESQSEQIDSTVLSDKYGPGVGRR